jgi:hypothetical protein
LPLYIRKGILPATCYHARVSLRRKYVLLYDAENSCCKARTTIE